MILDNDNSCTLHKKGLVSPQIEEPNHSATLLRPFGTVIKQPFLRPDCTVLAT